jgi:hypothetical protein
MVFGGKIFKGKRRQGKLRKRKTKKKKKWKVKGPVIHTERGKLASKKAVRNLNKNEIKGGRKYTTLKGSGVAEKTVLSDTFVDPA